MATSLGDIAARNWDYIIIGTGIGGGTLGYSLSRSGRSVLFLERGQSHLQQDKAILGDFPERVSSGSADAALRAGGRYAQQILDTSASRPRSFTPFIGAGTGGSSALYGMALERFFKQDFSPAAQHPKSPAALPAHWPVAYKELSPFYLAAERLYRVRGGIDPVRPDDSNGYSPAPPLSAPNTELHDFLSAQGLHPYQLPMACEFSENCSTCQSYLCNRGCKNDSSRICLQPAMERYDAQLLANCEVIKIDADGDSVNAVHCLHEGAPLQLKARNYVLAAGALETPRLLLSSACADWPTGLGNQNDLVGRYLMRHYIDLYAVFTRAKFRQGDLIKQLAFNDLYQRDGHKLGSVQSFGLLPPPELLAQDIHSDIRADYGAIAGTLFGLVKPLVRAGLAQILPRSVLLATTLEDLPFATNTVTLAQSSAVRGQPRLAINYRPGEGEAQRIAKFRDEMQKLLHPYRYLQLKQAENNHRLAHACGTCRFGETEKNSVCDADQKVHGISNLYIADSSVFPSSGGINPSLTIAALSLRLAARLGAHLND